MHRVAHKLNLRGPAICMQRPVPHRWWPYICLQGCSAVMRLALAGGVSLPNLKKEGYLYRKGGMIVSSTDTAKYSKPATDGTVFGNGSGWCC